MEHRVRAWCALVMDGPGKYIYSSFSCFDGVSFSRSLLFCISRFSFLLLLSLLPSIYLWWSAANQWTKSNMRENNSPGHDGSGCTSTFDLMLFIAAIRWSIICVLIWLKVMSSSMHRSINQFDTPGEMQMNSYGIGRRRRDLKKQAEFLSVQTSWLRTAKLRRQW